MPRRPQQPNADDDVEDDISNISDDEYGAQGGNGEEQRFKYSTADLANDSKRNTTCCIVAMCIVCLAVAIAVSIVMARSIDPGDDNETTGLNPNEQPGQSGNFPNFNKRRSQVDDDCNQLNYDTDPSKCRKTCDGFECCDPFATEGGCFHEKIRKDELDEKCVMYSGCHVTFGRIDPPADINFRDICAPENIANNRAACEELCQTTKCCYDAESASCAADDFWSCVHFAPCQHLRNDLKVPMPHEEINRICDGVTTLGLGKELPTCDEVCQPAACCFDGTCLESDFFTCIQYKPCKKVYDSEISTPPVGELITPPSQEMINACSGRAIAANGTAACEQACMAGSCCADGGSMDVNGTDFPCFTTDPLTCLLYDECQDI